MYRDKYNLLTQIQPDGSIDSGDSIHWNGAFHYLTADKRSLVDFYETEPGRWVRHPDPDCTYFGFGADHRTISRDAVCGILALIISERDKQAMKRFMSVHARRLFLFAFNTIHNGVDPKTAKWKLPDLTGPEILAQEIRGLEPGWYDRLLPVLDLHMLANTWFTNSVPAEQDNECISYLIKLFVSVEHKPTWVSRLSLRLVSSPMMLDKLRSYWAGWRGQPEMVDIYFNKLCQLKELEYGRKI